MRKKKLILNLKLKKKIHNLPIISDNNEALPGEDGIVIINQTKTQDPHTQQNHVLRVTCNKQPERKDLEAEAEVTADDTADDRADDRADVVSVMGIVSFTQMSLF